MKRIIRIGNFTLLLALLISIIPNLAFAAAAAAPGKPSITHNYYQGNTTAEYDISFDMWWGQNATSYKLYEKLNDGQFTVVSQASLTDATPNAQHGSVHFGPKDPGVYTYYVSFMNSYGTTNSDQTQVSVNTIASGDTIANNTKIYLTGYDAPSNNAFQITVPLGVTSIPVTAPTISNPVFTVDTNNKDVITPSISGSTLKITATKPGRSSLRIKANGEVRYVGVRVKNADGANPGMPDYLSIGTTSENAPQELSFWQDFTTNYTNKRMDVRYIYINGGPGANGWTSWSPNGGRATTYVTESLKLGMIPFFVFYNIADGSESYASDLQHIQTRAYMNDYFNNLKYFLDITKKYAGDDLIGIVYEPDFLGYMMQNSGKQPDAILAYVDEAYTSGVLVRGKDPDFPNTVAGLVNAINYITRKNSPQAFFGWQFNVWAYSNGVPGQGLMHATEIMGQQAGLDFIKTAATATAKYYLDAGVASYGADFISFDKYGLDGGAQAGAAADPKASLWFWNNDLWNNYLGYVKTIHEIAKKPVVLWQIPVGHINSSTAVNPYTNAAFKDLGNSSQKFEDSASTYFFGDTFNPGSAARKQYFAMNASNDPTVVSNSNGTVTWGGHMTKAVDAGVIHMMMGDGVGDSTHGRPSSSFGYIPSDDYYWITKVQQYYDHPAPLAPSVSDTTPPSNVTSLTATITANSVTLSWTAATDNVGVTGYQITGGPGTVNVTGTSASITGLQPNTTYTFTVKALDAAGNKSSGTSINVTTSPSADTTPPSAPANLAVTGKTSTSVSLSWNASTDNVGVTGYNVYQNGVVVPTGNVTISGTTAAVTGLTASTSYTFSVRAKDAAGNLSASSNSVSVTTQPSDVTGGAWAPNVAYKVNDQVTYSGHTYKCLQAHTSLSGWEPANVPALWQLIS